MKKAIIMMIVVFALDVYKRQADRCAWIAGADE